MQRKALPWAQSAEGRNTLSGKRKGNFVGGGRRGGENNGKESVEKEVWTVASHKTGRMHQHTRTSDDICTQITDRDWEQGNSRKPKSSKWSLSALQLFWQLTTQLKKKSPTGVCPGTCHTMLPVNTHGTGSGWKKEHTSFSGTWCKIWWKPCNSTCQQNL